MSITCATRGLRPRATLLSRRQGAPGTPMPLQSHGCWVTSPAVRGQARTETSQGSPMTPLLPAGRRAPARLFAASAALAAFALVCAAAAPVFVDVPVLAKDTGTEIH